MGKNKFKKGDLVISEDSCNKYQWICILDKQKKLDSFNRLPGEEFQYIQAFCFDRKLLFSDGGLLIHQKNVRKANCYDVKKLNDYGYDYNEKTNKFMKIENKKEIVIHNNNGLSKEDANMWNNRKMGVHAQEELNKQLQSKPKVDNLKNQFKKDFLKLLKKYQEHETLEKEFNVNDIKEKLELSEQITILVDVLDKMGSNENKIDLHFAPTKDIITDKAIDIVWDNADFGANQSKRGMIAQSLLKVACGYETGSTIRDIMNELGLISISRSVYPEGDNIVKLTQLGKEFLYEAYGR
jgi:hypothetical protein